MTDSDLVEYSSCDLLMRTTFTQDSVWEDLGVTEDSHRAAVAQNLAALGWNMVSETSLPALAQASPALFTSKVMLLSYLISLLQTAVVPMQITLAREGAAILQAMPLPVYTSHEVVVQVNMQC